MNNTTKMAVVTGAAGGVGAAYAEGLAKRGYDLLFVGRPGSAMQEIANRIARDSGRRVEIGFYDLSATTDIDRLAERLSSDTSIALLANIAGAATFSPFGSISPAQINQTIAVNISALTRLSRAVVPGFVARKAGTIVNFASILAFHPWPEFNVYNAAKAFVVTLSQSMQGELRDKGVLVQVVLPPATATPFWQRAGFAYSNLPSAAVMTRDDLVHAALVGLDRREEWVIPSLGDTTVWDVYQGTRDALVGGMMNASLANRYSEA